MRLRRILPFLTLAAALVAPTSSCLAPTEIDLVITTDEPPENFKSSDQRAAILIGPPSGDAGFVPTTVLATQSGPDGGAYGDLVIVPSGSASASVHIEVVLGVTQSTSSCVDPNFASKLGCIRASREIQYSPHFKLTLPITLESKCLNVDCGAGFTCLGGKCVDESPDCDGSTCGPSIDASFPYEASLDGPMLPDVTTTCTMGTLCSGKCTQVDSDPANCGDCGFDCTGGTCSGGTCVLSATANAACVAVTSTNLYAVTFNGTVMSLPKNGGVPSTINTTGVVTDLKAVPALAAIAVQGVPWSLEILPLQKVQTLPAGSAANVIAVDPAGGAWLDESAGQVWYQAFGSSQPRRLGERSKSRPHRVSLRQAASSSRARETISSVASMARR